jgi:hypothetical protein
MGDRVRHLEHEIDQARERLGENLHELEYRVARVTDWRGHVDERPFGMVSLAFAGGLLLAALAGTSGREGRRHGRPLAQARTEPGWRAPLTHAVDAIGGALFAMAAQRLTTYISELLPEFAEHYERAERASGYSANGSKEPASAYRVGPDIH